MFTIVLILVLAGVIFAASVRLQRPNVDHRLTIVLLVSYAARLGLSSLTRDLNVFSSMAGDYSAYEQQAELIARYWLYNGIHFVTEIRDELILAALPSNLFAFVDYINGEPTHLGCVAVVAAVACFVCLELYLLAQLMGASRDVALWTVGIASVTPSFLFYTSNTFKDGFVALFVIGTFGCAVRLSRKFSVLQLALGVAFLGCLWFTRFYLVFIVPPLLVLGLLGLRSRSILRTALASLVIVASVSALYAYSSTPEVVVQHATRTFNGATAENVLSEGAQGGSGVTFETESPTGTFVLKLLYTLFSPFPWQSGSLGLQIGKLEALVWYYFVYRAMRAAKTIWRTQPSDLLLFVSLIVPVTVAYAFTFSNIGLIARQRMSVVLATMLLASLSWGRQEEEVVGRRPISNVRRTA